MEIVEPVKVEIEPEAVAPVPETPEEEAGFMATVASDSWNPKTELGKAVKEGKLTSLNELLGSGEVILEYQITDTLLPDVESDLLFIGQSKGKFGGGQKRAFRQTQKKTPEGNKPSFAALVVLGNKNGIVGTGYGKSKDTVPAREEALRNAKLNIFKIRRGCGSWQCGCKAPHSIPFKVSGKCGSCEIVLMPAPRGKGLIVEAEVAKILAFAGIKDVWSKTYGQTGVKLNLIFAAVQALKQLSLTKVLPEQQESLGIVEGTHS